jgi:glycosyltransferase involved in cell wall biosynthesis
MRLLLVHQNFPGQYRDLVPALLQRGHQLVAIGSKPLKDVPQGLHYLHYEGQHDDREQRLVDPDLERSLRRAARVSDRALQLRDAGFKPDAILFHSGWGEGLYLRELFPEAVLIAYPELYAQPLLMGHGFDPDLGAISEGMRQALKRQNFMALAAIADSDAAVVPTLFQRDTFPAHLRGRFQVIHEGIDLSRARPHPNRHVQITPELMVRKGDPVITFVNRSLEPLRGFRTLMRALPEVQAQHPGVQVLIIGDPMGSSYSPPSTHPQGYRGEMLALLGHRLDLSRIHFLGRLPYEQLLAAFQVSAAHVYFSYPYALSWSVLEAMACGAVVVGSDNPPINDLIRDGTNGRLVPFAAHDTLATTLLEILNTPAASGAMGQAARQTIAQRYSLEASVLAYEQLITSLLLSAANR